MTVAVFNAKNVNNTLTDPSIGLAEDKAFGGPVPGISGSPCPVTKVAKLTVIRGYMTLGNLSFNKWILVGGSELPCHVVPYPYPDYWVFLPSSDFALPGVYTEPAPTHFSILTRGYYYPDIRFGLTLFEPGTYTVVAFDEWGQILLAHFSVTS